MTRRERRIAVYQGDVVLSRDLLVQNIKSDN